MRNAAPTGSAFASTKVFRSRRRRRSSRRRRPSPAGARAPPSSLAIARALARPARRRRAALAASSRLRIPRVSMSSGSASTTGPGRPDIARRKARVDIFAGSRPAVDLRRPLGDRRRTSAGSRSPETPRDPSCRRRPGRRTRSSASNPETRCGCRSQHWARPGPRVTMADAGLAGQLAVGLGHVGGRRPRAGRRSA